MAIIASEGVQREFYLVPADTYQACCYDVWDIGMQEAEYKGEKKIQHKIIISWELTETIPDGEYKGKRFVISRPYTLSLHEKASLRKDLESWRGKTFTDEELKGFDIERLIGANCMLSVIHKETGGRTYANVGGVFKLTRGLTPMVPENKRGIPEWIKKLQAKAIQETDISDDAPEIVEEEAEEIPF